MKFSENVRLIIILISIKKRVSPSLENIFLEKPQGRRTSKSPPPHPTSIFRVRKVSKVERRKSQQADDIFGKIIKINTSKCDFQHFKNTFYFNTVTNKLNNF